MKPHKPKRPVLRYHGGKWKLAPWIISLMPPHRVYVEPYGGGASVLLRKERVYCEVYNDLDREVVNLFRVLQDKSLSEALCHQVAFTAYARDEFVDAYRPARSRLERARRTVIKSFMGFGSASVTAAAFDPQTPNTGFRANSNKSGTTPAHDWANLPPHLATAAERLRAVVIENRPAIQVMVAHDGPTTLHYVDPPYVHSTRTVGNPYCRKGEYRHEMTDADHEELASCLHSLTGMVLLSGYRCELYDSLYSGWVREGKAAHADGARDRVECVWMNRAASEARGQQPLFGEAI